VHNITQHNISLEREMNIDEMEAGPELDVLMAEMVMGWVSQEYTDGLMYWMGRDAEGRFLATGWGASDNWPAYGERTEIVPLMLSLCSNGIWNPSQPDGIAAAWQVVKHLQKTMPPHWEGDGYDYFVIEAPNRIEDDMWWAGWIYPLDYGNPGTVVGAVADTAPLAICRAALLATTPPPPAGGE
jgi:hypothetical protein